MTTLFLHKLNREVFYLPYFLFAYHITQKKQIFYILRIVVKTGVSWRAFCLLSCANIAAPRFTKCLRGYIPFSGSKNQKNLYYLFLKYILLTMFLQNFIEIGALEHKIRPFIVCSFWNYLMST